MTVVVNKKFETFFGIFGQIDSKSKKPATYVADQRKNKKKSTRAAIICFAMLITAMLVTVSAI